MKKLKLDVDQVRVVSFAVETAKGSGGTVNGFARDIAIGRGGRGAIIDTGASCLFCVPDPVSEGSAC